MAKVHKIGITKNKGGHISEVNEVDVIPGKGIVNDRHFKEDNHIKRLNNTEEENVGYKN